MIQNSKELTHYQRVQTAIETYFFQAGINAQKTGDVKFLELTYKACPSRNRELVMNLTADDCGGPCCLDIQIASVNTDDIEGTCTCRRNLCLMIPPLHHSEYNRHISQILESMQEVIEHTEAEN